MQACGHGGTDGKDKALFKGPAQQAQHAVPLRAVREVGHAVRSRIANARIGVFGLRTSKGESKSLKDCENNVLLVRVIVNPCCEEQLQGGHFGPNVGRFHLPPSVPGAGIKQLLATEEVEGLNQWTSTHRL